MDYLDVAALLRAGMPLERMVGDAVAIFGANFSPMPALKALAYFDDPALIDLSTDIRNELRTATAAVSAIPRVRPAARRI